MPFMLYLIGQATCQARRAVAGLVSADGRRAKSRLRRTGPGEHSCRRRWGAWISKANLARKPRRGEKKDSEESIRNGRACRPVTERDLWRRCPDTSSKKPYRSVYESDTW